MIRSFKYILPIILLSFLNTVQASVPDLINFTTKDYKSHSINYDFVQDSTGVIYIGNAYCLLEYDGSTFRKIPLVNGKSALSLAKDNNGRIYVGSSSEFGYLKKNESQITVYHSLKNAIPGEKEFDQIRRVYNHNGIIYFSTIYKLYKVVDETIEEVKGCSPDADISNLSLTNNELIYWQQKQGLGNIKNNKASIFLPSQDSIYVTDIKWINNDYVLFGDFGIKSARNPGAFKDANAIIGDAQINSVLQTGEDEFLLGTIKEGIFVMNSKGKILRHLSMQHGLQDNYVHKLFQDNSGNVWVAYNNGVGILKWNSSIQYITNSQGFKGMGYGGVVQNDKLYISTSQGLYAMDNWENGLNKIENFSLVPGAPENTVNHLTIANGQLVSSQADEVYALKNGKIKMISPNDKMGAWIWSNADKFDKNEAIVGRYEGVSRYSFKNGEWQFAAHIKGFKESSRVLEIDKNGVIWAIQGNKGLYRIELNSQRDSATSVINYAEKMGYSPDLFNDIFYKNDTIYVTSFGGMFYLKGDSLIRDNTFDHIKRYVNRTRKFDEQGMYAIYKDQPFIIEKKKGVWQVKNSPVSFLRSNLVGSAEFFNKIAPGKYLIGTQDGFALYQPAKDRIPAKTKCLIRGIELLDEMGDSLLYSGEPKENLTFPYEHNNIRFTFTIPAFGEMEQVVYETQLKLDGKPLTNWQLVKDVNFREYTNLREGDYEFIVRAKKGDAVIGDQVNKFKITPPWYRTTAANAVYFVLLIIVGIIIKKRFDKQAEILKAEKIRELEIKEKLHKAEKLEIELQNKENELAYMALSYTQKKEMLATVMGKLDSLSKELEHTERNKVNSLKRSISTNMDDESNWDNFQVHFDQKNDNFFQKLKEIDGKLGESYLLFCSYVRMGKSNKEIAELLNISVAAVEKRKYRLKKKWELDDDMSFTDYLKSL